MPNKDLDYLLLLSKDYPTIEAVSTEIIHLRGILQLPKSTEHFMSDIHGEFEAFQHVLRNGAGSIRLAIEKVFDGKLPPSEQRALATLIYYPEQKISLKSQQGEDTDEWYRKVIKQLVEFVRAISRDFTRIYVQKRLPPRFAHILEELIYRVDPVHLEHSFMTTMLESVIETGMARRFIIAFANLIRALTIGHLHIIGDVYDRGPGAHHIMDTLMEIDSVDFQWGNHDIVWMGAAAGSEACMAHVVRMSLRHANMETLENGYAVSLLPLASFAMETYWDDPCEIFIPRRMVEELSENEQRLVATMHKAILVIQLKLEGQIIRRRPEYRMDDRLMLDKLTPERAHLLWEGVLYPMKDTNFPTVDPENPYELTTREQEVVTRLMTSFQNSEKLQRHVRYLFSKGSIYHIHDNQLLYHGCIPLKRSGAFQTFEVNGVKVKPKAFLDHVEMIARQGFFASEGDPKKQNGQDMMWYLWGGADSPLFGKEKMATFERYFLKNKKMHREAKDPYYKHRDQPKTARRILQAFGLDPDSAYIVNGHVPVRVRRGESPIKAGGRLLVIDGGFAEAYHEETGIAGYTLIDNADARILVAHSPFDSLQKAIESESEVASDTQVLKKNTERVRVQDTDGGVEMLKRISDLTQLLDAYRTGVIRER